MKVIIHYEMLHARQHALKKYIPNWDISHLKLQINILYLSKISRLWNINRGKNVPITGRFLRYNARSQMQFFADEELRSQCINLKIRNANFSRS